MNVGNAVPCLTEWGVLGPTQRRSPCQLPTGDRPLTDNALPAATTLGTAAGASWRARHLRSDRLPRPMCAFAGETFDPSPLLI